MMNDNIGHISKTRKSLKQGDPHSPILFSIVVDFLAILIARAKVYAQVKESRTSFDIDRGSCFAIC
jgi:hypothetical protein